MCLSAPSGHKSNDAALTVDTLLSVERCTVYQANSGSHRRTAADLHADIRTHMRFYTYYYQGSIRSHEQHNCTRKQGDKQDFLSLLYLSEQQEKAEKGKLCVQPLDENTTKNGKYMKQVSCLLF